MAALDNTTRTRLVRLLGMIGSQHDGEALNAARLANKLVRDDTGETFLRLEGLERLGIPEGELARLGALAVAAPLPVGELRRVQ